jgi:signal transduction histidine kinase
MAKYRSHSIEFKRQVAQEFIAGETLHGLAKRHNVTRNLIRVTTGLDRQGHVLVTVEDSGPGLDQVGFERIFEPFVTTKREGMGLGLAICRSIVQSHGGRLWAATNAPHGSIFSFTMPIPYRQQ